MDNYLNTDFDFNSDLLIELFDEVPLWSAPFGLKLLDSINIKKNMNVLDIGFGAGFPLTELAMRLGDSSKVYGIDCWEAAIKRAEKKIDFYGIKNIEIICGVAEDMPLDDNSIDLITSNNGINNVSDLHKSLSECARVMKQGGQFVQTMNLNSTMIEFYDAMSAVLTDLNMNTELEKMGNQIYKKRKPLDEFTKLMEQYGFVVENIITDQFDYKFTDGTTMLKHYFIRVAFLDGWKDIVPPERHIEVFTRVEKLMNEKAEKEGFFKLSVPFVLIDCTKA